MKKSSSNTKLKWMDPNLVDLAKMGQVSSHGASNVPVSCTPGPSALACGTGTSASGCGTGESANGGPGSCPAGNTPT